MKMKLFIALAGLLFVATVCLAQTMRGNDNGNSREQGEAKVREIKVTAFQYGYNPGIITVKKGETVKIIATSKDVTHGFAIKEYGIDVVLKKGENKEIKFVADKIGVFDIECSVYCGPGHEEMKAKLIVRE